MHHNNNYTFSYHIINHCHIFSPTNPLISITIKTDDNESCLLQHVQWTPDNGLLIVHNNDIYHKSQVQDDPHRVTSDGVPGVVFNGISDWIYKGCI